MSNMEETKKISSAVIRRLPRYYRYLGELIESGVQRISSKELSARMKVTASQIRQDLNNFGGFGQQGYGYNVKYLYDEIAKILGIDRTHNMIIIGAGNLGAALVNSGDFAKRGFIIKGVFDNNHELKGKKIGSLDIMMMDELKGFIKENNISDTWESMNLNTFESYQKYLVDNGRGSVTIRNIIQNTLFPLLKKVSKRVDIPFTWYDSNLNSFEFVKDESNKELASNKKVTLTEEQLKQLYDYPITGTELQVRKRTEIRDLFVLQCLVGQRVGKNQQESNLDFSKAAADTVEKLENHSLDVEQYLKVTDRDYETLLKIVEAEAGGEDTEGKIMVANVIFNRLQSPIFPDSIYDIVWQNTDGTAQFSPTADGRINTVTVSEDTREAVNRAIDGEDYSQGALFFMQEEITGA